MRCEAGTRRADPHPAPSPPSAVPPTPAGQHAPPVVVDRRDSPNGEIVLRRREDRYEIIVNGCFLMDTSDGRSERLLIRAALDEPHRGAPMDHPPSVLIGGLGVGFSLAEAAAEPRWGRIVVVEREQAVIDWHHTGPLTPFGEGALDDPRVELVHADLLHHLAAEDARYDALCLDIDNGPDWTVSEPNAGLYTAEGLALVHRRLAPGGVLAVWGAQASQAFERALASRFTAVHTLEIAVPRGAPDVIHLARNGD